MSKTERPASELLDSEGRQRRRGQSGDGPGYCPRNVWWNAVDGRSISITVRPDPEREPVTYSGEVVGRNKGGTAWSCTVTVRFVPPGELAPVEIEAEKEHGEWGPFRAFHWKTPRDPRGQGPHFAYVGRVESVEFPEDGPEGR